MRSNLRGGALLTLLVLTAGLTLFGCKKDNGPGNKYNLSTKNNMVWWQLSDIERLNPYTSTDAAAAYLQQEVWESLNAQDPRSLELIRFPSDPRGSHAERLEWTKATLKKLLDATEAGTGAKPEAAAERAQRESLLSLYLVSLLTLDPRDPEAFFHLGKLARTRETILSAIRYGRDLGLEHAKIVELEAVADRLSL